MLKHSTNLIFSKRFILFSFFVFFTIGSYTYSEDSKHPRLSSSVCNLPLITTNTSFSGIRCFSLKLPGLPKPETTDAKENINAILPSEFIMDNGLISAKHLASFLTYNNNSVDYHYAVKLAQLYIDEASHEGVNPDIAFTQMCLETGFLRFDGTVNPSQNNFCGLGVTSNGVEGLCFEDEQIGIRAHIQHLKAYASVSCLNKKLVDSRFHFVKRGTVKDISGLTGKWATDKHYDKKIRNLLQRLYSLETS